MGESYETLRDLFQWHGAPPSATDFQLAVERAFSTIRSQCGPVRCIIRTPTRPAERRIIEMPLTSLVPSLETGDVWRSGRLTACKLDRVCLQRSARDRRYAPAFADSGRFPLCENICGVLLLRTPLPRSACARQAGGRPRSLQDWLNSVSPGRQTHRRGRGKWPSHRDDATA